MNRPVPASIDDPPPRGLRFGPGVGRRARRRGRLTWLLALSFAFMQWVLPAYACALAFPMETVGAPTQAVAEASCDRHASFDSLLCFKHCHPEDESSGGYTPAMPLLADLPAIPAPGFEPVAIGVRFSSSSPGIPPPIAISYCRLQR